VDEKLKKSNIHSKRIIASVDVQAATEFPEQIRTVIERGGCPPN
jgi:hypothetical protein